MVQPENRESAGEPAGERTLIVTATWWGRVCATLGVLLILAIAADIVFFERLYGDAGGALGAGIILLCLFMAWVPVGLFSLAGAVLSSIAWRKHPSRQTRTAFWLCLGNPIAGALFFGGINLTSVLFNWP